MNPVKSRDSLLTTSSGYTNYRGILNLVIILLVLSNARAALENIIKYGILVDPLSWLLFLCQGQKHWPSLLITMGLSVPILISLTIEKVIAQTHLQNNRRLKLKTNGSSSLPDGDSSLGKHSQAPRGLLLMVADAALVLNLVACILLPPIVIYTNDTHPISTSLALMLVSVVFLKLVSYHMMNFWCRDFQTNCSNEKLQSRTTRFFLRSYVPPAVEFSKVAVAASTNGHSHSSHKSSTATTTTAGHANKLQEISKPDLEVERVMSIYPGNVTLKSMLTFMSYPTLCYELEYAKTQRIRKRFLIKRIIELIILGQMDMALIQQWIVPTVSNSLVPFRQMQVSHMLERLLKLAIPNHVIWLIWFYLFFHSLLNIVAELTKFADREFYRDWWNSESVHYFWSNWNIPVHKWCVRHLYMPLMAVGLTRCQASTAVFMVSAFFHEYLVSVPLKLFRMWAFTGMLIQLPWARFVSSYFNQNFANVAVWVSLIIGQPLCILMYYHDYYVINYLSK